MLNRFKYLCILVFCFYALSAQAQQNKIPYYQNPIIHADYSDPDVISVGKDFYMVASSFNAVPGIPILHSTNLVNWEIIGHALQQQVPTQVFDTPQHGNGVWAPAIRFHKNEFYIYYPDPDQGIFLTKAKQIIGPWSTPVLVEAGKGLIDPCPYWEEDDATNSPTKKGKVYLVHAYAGSRAGFKSIIVIKELNATADKVISNGVLVYDGHTIDPTIEGPKLYKRNGYYYIFAPAGGVSTGWQTVLRSKNIYGPYERKVVMQQGSSTVNGPHQGAWVQTQTKEDWFIHFQDKEAYGRIIHLQPMQWKNDWPIIGEDKDGDGISEPVAFYKMPTTFANTQNITIADSDDFNAATLGLQWQWNANPKANWAFCYPTKGALRLNAVLANDTLQNLWHTPNVLLQKFPAESFAATAKVSFTAKTVEEKFGLLVMGLSYAAIELVNKKDGMYIQYTSCANADKKNTPMEKLIAPFGNTDIYLKLAVESGGICNFSYSTDGISFQPINEKFIAKPGKWIGAKFGFFCTRKSITNDAGFADIDWIHITK